MGGMIRAVATDLDGTLTHDGTIDSATLAALATARSRGVTLILVTGRIGSHLDEDFPGLREVFDAVVLENGAVLTLEGEQRLLGSPVDPELVAALHRRHIECRVGRVILDVSTDDAATVGDLIGELGLDAQIVRNRGRSMVVPAGLTKGTGLRRAVRELGLSHHNVLAVGDAENDLALLQAAEVGVAVANAVPSLRHRADVVLDQEDGAGLHALLEGPVIAGSERVTPERHRIRIGTHLDDGSPVLIPGAGANVLIKGASGTGKSHLAGLLIEKWLRQEYSVLVLDVEGDYHGLSHLPDVVTVDGSGVGVGTQLASLLRQRSTAVILELARLDAEEVADVVRGLQPVIEAERAAWGMPHWVVLDEAHTSLGVGGTMEGLLRPGDRGFLVVTFRPEDLRDDVAAHIDVTITATGRSETGAERVAVMAQPNGEQRAFAMAARRTPHVRHWHKYTTMPLPQHHWFSFTDDQGRLVARAENVAAFCDHVRTLDSSVIWGHLERGDFSRWLVNSLHEYRLAGMAGAIERDVLARKAVELRRARERLVLAVEEFYGIGPEEAPPGPPDEGWDRDATVREISAELADAATGVDPDAAAASAVAP